MTCPFCTIDLKKTEILFEDSTLRVVLSNPRLMPGHLLVIPKKHVEKLADLSKKERAHLFDTVSRYQSLITQKLAGGCDVRQHYRPFQKESELKVAHLHVHLHPRELEDNLYQEVQKHESGVFKPLSSSERTKISSLLRG